MQINKDEALKRLTALETEASALRKIIDAPVKITDRVKTFEDACEVLGLQPKLMLHEVAAPDEIAYIKLKTIAAALNEGWKPNWQNSREYKYYPWFDLSSSSGFSFHDYDYRSSISAVGSRLCFKTDELATYAGKQFIELYKDLMTF